jgi:hypothetical protein
MQAGGIPTERKPGARMTAQHKWLLWGAGLAAVALMAWTYLFWAVSPLPFSVVRPLPDEEAVLKVFRDTQLVTGVYNIPGLAEAQGMDGAYFEKAKAGPIGQIFFRREGSNPLNPLPYLAGLAHFFLVGLALGALLLWVRPVLPGYGARLGFVLAVSACAALAVDFAPPLWWHHPWGFHALTALYDAGSGLVSGVVLAWALDPRRLEAPAPGSGA